MKLNLFDLHCDTALSVFNSNGNLDSNDLHISLERASVFDKYVQVMAIWCPKEYDNDKGYKYFHHTLDYLLKCIEKSKIGALQIRSANGLKSTEGQKKPKNRIIVAVEDARILDGEADRLKVLYSRGVRFLTLLWSGVTCIGGAHDTDVGLSAFGKETVRKCFELGIVPDVSHASVRSFYDTAEIADEVKLPIVATHSDSYSVNRHTRNLSDKQFEYIVSCHGLVGINLFREHLGTDTAGVDYAVRHIEKYMELGGEKTVCFGCDFDGCETPSDICGVSDLIKIADRLASLNYPQSLIDDIFYNNAYNFAINNLK